MSSTGDGPVIVRVGGGGGGGTVTTSGPRRSAAGSRESALIRATNTAARAALFGRLGIAGSRLRTGPVDAAQTTPYHGYAVAERWNGTSWTLQSLPQIPRTEMVGLSSVSCASATQCLAVGAAVEGAPGYQLRPVAELWNGADWRLLPLPTHGPAVTSVSCPTTTSCLAVGTDAESGNSATRVRQIADRWDGRTWKLIRLAPSPKGALPFLETVSCPSVADCTVAGTVTVIGRSSDGRFEFAQRPDAQHWGGRAWVDESLPTPVATSELDLVSIACSAGRSCAAVGDVVSTRRHADFHPLVEAWNGRTWRHQVGPHPGSVLEGVSCPVAGTCTAVGVHLADHHVRTWAERTQGPRWVVEPTPREAPDQRFLNDVACSTTSCVAVGSTSGGALIEQRASSS